MADGRNVLKKPTEWATHTHKVREPYERHTYVDFLPVLCMQMLRSCAFAVQLSNKSAPHACGRDENKAPEGNKSLGV